MYNRPKSIFYLRVPVSVASNTRDSKKCTVTTISNQFVIIRTHKFGIRSLSITVLSIMQPRLVLF
jgi:ABC-type transporter lipoprotein component MlaA